MDDLESSPPPPSPTGPGRSLVDRVKAILLRPTEEWPRIADEPATIGSIYRSYVIPLSAIPPVALFIGMSVFGMNLGFVRARLPFSVTLVQALLQYGLGLLFVYILSLIIDALAPSFDGTRNPVAAFKVAAYSATAGWVAGIFNLFPALVLLALIISFYSLYLFWLGLPRLMRVPEDKAVGYAIVVIIVAIVLLWVIFVIVSTVTRPMMTYATTSVAGTISVPGGGSVDLGKLDAASKQMQAEVAAIQSGNVKAVSADQLQAMLPAAVANFARTGISSTSMGAAGLGGSHAEGTYKSGDQQIRLEVTDLGAAAGIAALGSAFDVNESRQDENGYEKTANVDGRMTTERWDKVAGRGEYGVLVAKHFLVKASGQAPVETLKQAVASVDFAKLETLAQR